MLFSIQDGDTPLHKASAVGHEVIVEMLLNAGANHSSVNKVSKSHYPSRYI